MSNNPKTVRVIDSTKDCPSLPLVVGEGRAVAVIWPEMGAIYRTFHTIDLGAGARTIDLSHKSESAYYVREGSGAVRDVTTNSESALVEGAMIHIGAGDVYRFEARELGLRLIGGPCPADLSLYETVQKPGGS